jgi:hypothetical protein
MKYKEIVNFIVKHGKEANDSSYCEQCKKPWSDGFCECDGVYSELWQSQCGVVSYLYDKYDITEDMLELYEYLIENTIENIIDKGCGREDIIDTILFEKFGNCEKTICNEYIVSEINHIIDNAIGNGEEIIEEYSIEDGKLIPGNLYVKKYTTIRTRECPRL